MSYGQTCICSQGVAQGPTDSPGSNILLAVPQGTPADLGECHSEDSGPDGPMPERMVFCLFVFAFCFLGLISFCYYSFLIHELVVRINYKLVCIMSGFSFSRIITKSQCGSFEIRFPSK